MNKIQTIFKNMGWLFFSQIIASVCAFVWTILLARYLGVNDYGIMNFAISFTGISAILMDLGMSTHIVRHIATDYDSSPKYLGNAIPLKTILSLLAFIITLFILILMKSDELTIQVTLLFTIERIFVSITGLLNGSLQAVEEGKYQAVGNILLNILLLIFILISIGSNFGLYGIAISYLLANFIVVIFQYIAVKKRLSKPKFELNWNFYKTILILSIPFALNSFFSLILSSVDMVMITNMISSYANGIYSSSYKLISIFSLLQSVYFTVIFPVMSRLFKNEKKLLIFSFEKSIKYLMLIVIPLSFSIMLYSSDIINLLYGKEYLPASQVLVILMWTVPLGFVAGICANLLNASHKEKTVTLNMMIMALFNFIFNLFIIPIYSYNGAAFTTVLSDILSIVLFFYSIYKLDAMPKRKLAIDLIKIIIGSVILIILLSILNLNMWVALPVGIIFYLILILLFKTFDDDDKYIMKEILGKN